MADLPEDVEFPTSEALLQYLREHTDDVDSMVIPVQEGVDFKGPQGQIFRRMNVGAVIKLCSGRSLAIHRDDASMLINDGVLQRMKIKCVLDTLGK